MYRFSLLLALAILAGCANSSTDDNAPEPLQTMQVDLQRYQGTWYELARLPMYFQRGCLQSQAQYELDEQGQIDVTNRCLKADGQWKEATAKAWPQVEGRTDKLWVRFDNWFSRLAPGLTKGHYWVIYHDPDYRYALVGNPDREYLWLLSRTPEVDASTREQLLQIARDQGFDIDKLVWRQD